MKGKRYFLAALASILVGVSGNVSAQNSTALNTREAKLLELAERLRQRDANDLALAQTWSLLSGIPMRQDLPGGGVLQLQRIVPGAGPVFYITNNLDAADSVSTDEVWSGGSAGLNLEGAGMVVGEWDGGAVYPAHTDFIGRLTQMDGATEVSGHSTHVAGTLIGAGDGLEPRSRGMAYAAQLDAWDWNSDTAEMAAAAAGGLLISNHSYGIAAGWIYIGGAPPDTWWWIGGANPSDVEDPYFGFYDAESQLWDQIAVDAPYYLIVKASGNDRSDTGPAPGEPYTVIDQDGNFLFTSTLPRQPDCAPAGYDCLPTHSVAKNVLTVGAVDDVPGGYSPLSGPSQVQMSPFSSWGPTDDGRIKPDLVGNGVFLISAWPDSPFYAAAAGTSMAAPNVTGSLLLLQEHYENENGPGMFMRSATLKALAIHTADEAGAADGPDYEFGWGLLNTKAAAEVVSGNGVDHQMHEGSLADGATDSYPVNVSDPDSRITATLVWMDPPGTPPAFSLDPPDLMLVNDLDLRLIEGGTTHFPWVLDPALPANAATRGDNFRDNVELVEVNGIGPGTYSVQVSHKGSLQSGLNQDYALIISVSPAPPVGSGLVISEDFSGGLPAGWSIVTNPGGKDWTINSPVGGDPRLDNLTGGSGQFAIVDNNYSYQTVTSMRTNLLDLSSNDAAVLRFKSSYYYDTFESLNVDASTDGGSSWFEVWTFQGFNPFPTQYVLDLSSAIAGHANVRLAFRFDSEGFISGDYWQVDDVELEVFGGNPQPGDPPGAATDPSPTESATDVPTDADLDWTAGADTDTHDVYFGTDPSPGIDQFQVSQAPTGFDPGTLNESTTYYWRIDEVNEFGTTTGPVWSFTTGATVPAASVHLADLQGSSVEASRGRWEAIATVHVENEGGLPQAGVQVDGQWSNGANGADNCITGADGSCSISKPNLKGNTGSVDFAVTGLVLPGHAYDSGANEVSVTIVIFKPAPNALPDAVDDNFSTAVDTPLNENAMANDDQGDAPATVTAYDGTSAGGFGVSMSASGDFAYTPTGGFTGIDSFGYTITDDNGDSDSATVTVTVGSPALPRTVTATESREKGSLILTISWSNFVDATVTISRKGVVVDTVATATGQWQDNLGKKPSGTFDYEVCEGGPTAGCAGVSVIY